jgi:hypothetical protein
MGAFNTLVAETTCPSCGKKAIFEIQFKFGDTWQYHYTIGEKLRWGGNDKGFPNLPNAKIEGVGGPCPYCKEDCMDFDISLKYDEISGVEPAKWELKE